MDSVKESTEKREELIALSNIFVAEFNALRRELEICIEHQKEIMNFSVLAFIAMVGLFGVAKTRTDLQEIAPAFLFFPLIFCLLALLYADKTIRILRVADYIHNYLRKKVDKRFHSDFWEWEYYKSHKTSYRREFAMGLDRLRWLIFVTPSIIAIVLFLLLDGIQYPYNEKVIFLLFLDSVTIMVSIYVMSQLEETAPIKDRKAVDLKKDRKRKI